MDLLPEIAVIATSLAFISGFLITAITGSAKAVKTFLGILSVILILASIVGLIFSGGLLVFLLFQIISLAIIGFFVIILGAVAGGGIYLLRHKKPRGTLLNSADIEGYLPASEFSVLEGITEERAVARITSGFYRGGLHDGNWYIAKAELSQVPEQSDVLRE